jgi:putative pyruvate formate lyase activating enzyme
MATFTPAYITAAQSGKLDDNIIAARNILTDCVLCPRQCHVNRTIDETGVCRTGATAKVSSFSPHFGEEAPLVGRYGSGTIFFTHCSLSCIFCQNYEISHDGWGNEVTDAQLASMMLALQEKGCHNINFVTPTHVTPQILSAVRMASEQGLSVPLVYNCGGYERIETLRLLDGIIDIYMPDFKFWDSLIAQIACQAPDYPEIARQAILEMHRQTGDLVIDDKGFARRGLLLRHLVLPDDLAGTRDIMRFIADSVSKNTYVNIMSQYRPCGRAHETPGLNRQPTPEEFRAALTAAREEGITRLDP